MYNYSFVTVHKGRKRSIINYVSRNAFKDLPSVVLLHVCFGILFFNLFLHGTCVCGKQNETKHNRSLGRKGTLYFVEVENQENWF